MYSHTNHNTGNTAKTYLESAKHSVINFVIVQSIFSAKNDIFKEKSSKIQLYLLYAILTIREICLLSNLGH